MYVYVPCMPQIPLEEKEGIDPGAAVTRCMFVNWGVLGAKPSSSARATHALMTVLSLPQGPPSPQHTVLTLCSCGSFVCFENRYVSTCSRAPFSQDCFDYSGSYVSVGIFVFFFF